MRSKEVYRLLECMQMMVDEALVAYKLDFIYDVDTLLHAEENKMMWFVRTTGTNICKADDAEMIRLYREHNDVQYRLDLVRGEIEEVWRAKGSELLDKEVR